MPLTAPPVQERDAMPAASSAKAENEKEQVARMVGGEVFNDFIVAERNILALLYIFGSHFFSYNDSLYSWSAFAGYF